jgi:hypothetical protein
MGSEPPLYVVSDVHGHRRDLVDALADAGLVTPGRRTGPRWAGGAAHLWVLGDLLDRGPDGLGVIELVMSLQEQAPDQVHVLMGNHEALAWGRHQHPAGRFADSWRLNGGRARDQRGLRAHHLEWLRSLPVIARAGRWLLVHSDTTEYLRWGADPSSVNATVRSLLRTAAEEDAWEVWAGLTNRYEFLGPDGEAAAARMLDTYGGEQIVHGHSIIGSLVDLPSAQVTGPWEYAGGRALAVDGGRYDGGPLLLVQLV